MKCPKCGKNVSGKFCTYCGTALSENQANLEPKKKKGKGCLIAIGVFVVLGIIGAALGGNEEQKVLVDSSESGNISESSTASDAESTVPVVKGSNAYDITVSLEEKGLPGADRSETSDGFTFTATNTDYSYTIKTDEDYALSYADYYVFGEDNGFLAFCASFPYDAADSQAIMSWVNENIGTEAQTTIGDAEFYLSVAETGPMLKVQAVGRSEYLENKIIE